MAESNCQLNQVQRKHADEQASRQARSTYDLSIVGLLLLTPVVVTELWFATYDSYYLRRHFTVEFGSRFSGDVYTASIHCPHGSEAYTPMFRAWSDQDAASFLEKNHAGCHISDVMSGGKVYRTRIWHGSRS